MDSWIPIAIVIVVFIFIVGTFSTLHKNSSMPLRKKSLNELKETLPRTHKTEEKQDSFPSKK